MEKVYISSSAMLTISSTLLNKHGIEMGWFPKETDIQPEVTFYCTLREYGITYVTSVHKYDPNMYAILDRILVEYQESPNATQKGQGPQGG